MNKSEQQQALPKLPPIRLIFPWFSLLFSVLVITLLILSQETELLYQYPILQNQFTLNTKLAALLFLGTIYLVEISLFFSSQKKAKKLVSHLKSQLAFLFKSKKQEQQKVHLYSNHTEKLKLFISDKLLEYIEYDEKFIHFKGIAAEIRHNGIISFDKVITALQHAIEQQHFLNLYESPDYTAKSLRSESGKTSLDSAINVHQTHSNEERSIYPHNLQEKTMAILPQNERAIQSIVDYRSAIDAMRYLWDLLDLSTAENLALHIGNQLIECEELYFQQHLSNSLNSTIPQRLSDNIDMPTTPVFFPQLAILTSITGFCDEPIISEKIALGKINEAEFSQAFYFSNSQFILDLAPTEVLLGNVNHIRLLLENLVKNALFFSQRKTTKKHQKPIFISLKSAENHIRINIYNHGPHIADENLQDIFKLGYSTRRKKAHHGKGLGLFFCKEIINGYQGHIQPLNLYNQPQQYQLDILLANDELHTYNIAIQLDENKLLGKTQLFCQLILAEQNPDSDSLTDDDDEKPTLKKSIVLEFDIPIISLCIAHADKQDEKYQSLVASYQPFKWLAPSSYSLSQWQITIAPFKKQHQLIFEPLDINGVMFDIKIPTAESRLQEQEFELGESNLDSELEKWSHSFQTLT
ncbi:ATP-binding protein [Aliikangiella maris]|uniref:ATP-binding protein n=2 Tax=Aliikangiella maris TaxID=3162458 RepID=A0ABV3MN58_9GAMM